MPNPDGTPTEAGQPVIWVHPEWDDFVNDTGRFGPDEPVVVEARPAAGTPGSRPSGEAKPG